jgi:hypothetical protein
MRPSLQRKGRSRQLSELETSATQSETKRRSVVRQLVILDSPGLLRESLAQVLRILLPLDVEVDQQPKDPTAPRADLLRILTKEPKRTVALILNATAVVADATSAVPTHGLKILRDIIGAERGLSAPFKTVVVTTELLAALRPRPAWFPDEQFLLDTGCRLVPTLYKLGPLIQAIVN